ncbi:MAG: DUF4037 domain-containing protein [Defluviitaleaceae bacterium]|nr:DUF4037 domain-containing protein [Defluviitaleaceae bacterium]MCL2836710.1 DUF4037 domain-containing protein [Defluviitaleaceae bacterium]
MSLHECFYSLINAVSSIDGVLSIGKSGGEKLPVQNESDIDIFVFCNQIPNAEARQAALRSESAVSEMKISETGGRFWGVCDFITVDTVEICLMYFTVSDMNGEIESVLNGSRLDRENEYFYPTGRCATFLSMYILYDKNGYISDMKEKLSVYPQLLSKKLYNHHILKVNDNEDFERAVRRGDVLFYHATLERAADHYFQALFALNKCFFPSRKRTLSLIEDFKYKPTNCSARLLEVIELGARAETLSKSYEIWSALCKELLDAAERTE